MGTLYWMTLLISKSSPRAATSVEMRILILDFWNFSSFSSLCFCIMWECSDTDLSPAASMKNFTLLLALMVLVNKMHFAPYGSSLMQHRIMAIFSISSWQKQNLSFSFAGRNICELKSMILGLASNFTRESRAFSLGMQSSEDSSLPLMNFSLLSPLPPFPPFALLSSLCLRSSLLSFFSASIAALSFLMKYFIPLKSRVRVADMKKILLLSLPMNSFCFWITSWSTTFQASACLLRLGLGASTGLRSTSPWILKRSMGISKSWSVATELRLKVIFLFLPFSRTQNSLLVPSAIFLLISLKSPSQISFILGENIFPRILSSSMQCPISIMRSASSTTRNLKNSKSISPYSSISWILPGVPITIWGPLYLIILSCLAADSPPTILTCRNSVSLIRSPNTPSIC